MLDQQLSSIEGLEPSFAQRVSAMLAASNGRVSVMSGLRTTAQQQALWDKAKATYGENAADKWAAQPGSSNHETGNAVDLQGDLQLAHSLLPQFGLVAPMPWEAWHVEPSGMQTNSAAYTVPPPGYPDPTSPAAQTSTQSHLAALTQALAHLDPQDRAAVQASQPAPISGGGPAHLSPEDQAPSTPGTVAPAATNASPVAPPTAPAPVQPQAQSTASVIASPSVTGDTQKLLQGQPITDGTPEVPPQGGGATGSVPQAKISQGSVTGPASVTVAPGTAPDPKLLTAFLQATRQHESGGNYQAGNARGGAYGAYQFTQGTWDGVAREMGRADLVGINPAQVAPADQDAVAAFHARQAFMTFGSWRAAAETWYYPAWAGDPSHQDSVPMPQDGNTLTIGAYGDTVLRMMNGILGASG